MDPVRIVRCGATAAGVKKSLEHVAALVGDGPSSWLSCAVGRYEPYGMHGSSDCLLHLLSGFQWLKVNDGYLLWLGVPDFVKLYNCPPWKVTFEDMAAWYLYHNLLEGPLGMAFVSIQEYVWHEMTLNHFRCGSKSWDRHSTSLATIWGMFDT